MSVDWSQFSADPPPTAVGPPVPLQGVDWSQFSTAPPGADQGPPQASFQNVTAGVTPTAPPLAQFGGPSDADNLASEQRGTAMYEGVKGDIQSGIQGNIEDYQYPEDGRRVVGIGEGFARGLYSDVAGIADMVSRATPEGAAEHIAGVLTGQPTELQREGGAVALNPDTERYASARAETAGELGHQLVSNFLPVDRLAAGASRLMRGAEDALHVEAVAGVHGPEAQGAAVADQLAGSNATHAGDLGPEALQPFPKQTPQEAAGAATEPVPAAPVDTAAAQGAGEAQTLSTGAPVQEPAGTPAGAPESSELAPETTPGSQLAVEPEPQVLSSADLTPEEQASFDRQQMQARSQLPDAQNVDNASGESSASVEAQGRVRDEQAAGQTRAVIENDGTVRPLTGVDAVDTHAREGQVIVQRGIGEDPNGWTVLSNGDNIPPRLVEGRVNAARDALEQTHAESIRSGEGQAGVGGEEPTSGEVGVRGDLQQPGEQEPHSLPSRLRGQGEGAAAPAEQEALGPTGIKNAQVAAEREAMGYEAVKHDLSRTDPEGWARAEAKTAENPNYGKDLAESLAKTPRPISKEEVFALTQDRQRIRTERRAAYNEAEKALDSGDPEAAAQARARADRLDEEMDKNDVAARVTGHENSEGLRARQRLAQEDYSMAALVQRAKVRKGSALTDAERAHVESIAKDIETREAAVSAREAAVREAEATPRSPRVAKDATKRFNDLAEELKGLSRTVLCEVA